MEQSRQWRVKDSSDFQAFFVIPSNLELDTANNAMRLVWAGATFRQSSCHLQETQLFSSCVDNKYKGKKIERW
jgi:hypothetical protein